MAEAEVEICYTIGGRKCRDGYINSESKLIINGSNKALKMVSEDISTD